MAKRKKRKLRKNPDSKTLWVVGGLAAAAYFLWWKPRQDQKADLLKQLKAVEAAIASNTAGKEKALELQAVRTEILKKLQALHLT